MLKGWTDKNTMQGLDRETNGLATRKQEEQIANEKSDKCGTPSTMFPMMCCCTKCCCNCGTKFGDPNGSKKPESKPTQDRENTNEHTMKKIRNQQQRSNEKNSRTRMCMISGGVELVPLLARRRAMQRPFSLSTTDITKCPNANK